MSEVLGFIFPAVLAATIAIPCAAKLSLRFTVAMQNHMRCPGRNRPVWLFALHEFVAEAQALVTNQPSSAVPIFDDFQVDRPPVEPQVARPPTDVPTAKPPGDLTVAKPPGDLTVAKLELVSLQLAIRRTGFCTSLVFLLCGMLALTLAHGLAGHGPELAAHANMLVAIAQLGHLVANPVRKVRPPVLIRSIIRAVVSLWYLIFVTVDLVTTAAALGSILCTLVTILLFYSIEVLLARRPRHVITARHRLTAAIRKVASLATIVIIPGHLAILMSHTQPGATRIGVALFTVSTALAWALRYRDRNSRKKPTPRS